MFEMLPKMCEVSDRRLETLFGKKNNEEIEI